MPRANSGEAQAMDTRDIPPRSPIALGRDWHCSQRNSMPRKIFPFSVLFWLCTVVIHNDPLVFCTQSDE